MSVDELICSFRLGPISKGTESGLLVGSFFLYALTNVASFSSCDPW